MSSGSGHPLAYPLTVTIGALAVCAAWAPFGTLDQLAAIATVALGVIAYTGYRLGVAFGLLPFRRSGSPRTVRVTRVRQQHRLVSRSWLQIAGTGRPRWLPVYFDPTLITLTETEADLSDRTIHSADRRLYPSGRLRDVEPPGRLIDNPSRPDPDAPAHAAKATRLRRRLLLDAQSTVAAPFAALLWVYIDGGSLPTFLAATTIAAATTVWLSAIRGSDPT
ncbi:hypothetical protein OHA40_16345 [Nocardia sp. NBC_00508]|uniref:hypothetical protein n=1 Tax=Nocardia sp. NBC_00508 TaxID=2975992 RepID=UPI002E80DFAA|nr:hypothetical protein [Nocardia sp. NBC_00508]WUD69551.1 hypothetical protein OHA40_16345 [Nocardia sp. NBC_00508]